MMSHLPWTHTREFEEEARRFRSVRGRESVKNDTYLLNDVPGKGDMVRCKVRACVRQEDLAYMSTQTEFTGCVEVERIRIHA